ncbi:MAG: LemA family protein [Dehalococcoidia bacterium]|nr:LemA family protein [Dehalococcoidia bacterium]
MIGLFIALGVVVLLVVVFIGIYNGLVGLRNQVKNAWAQIDVQLKRRYDLIPNLVETVKGFAKHEREVFEKVTQARAAAQGAAGAGPAERSQAEGGLSQALGRLIAVAEAYPQLKANQNFLSLQEELTSTENRISFSRQFYNDSVLRYNNKTQMFPSNVIAGIAGFKPGEFFEVTSPEEKNPVKVSFN